MNVTWIALKIGKAWLESSILLLAKKNEFNLPAPFLNQFQRELNHFIYNLLQTFRPAKIITSYPPLLFTGFLENRVVKVKFEIGRQKWVFQLKSNL